METTRDRSTGQRHPPTRTSRSEAGIREARGEFTHRVLIAVGLALLAALLVVVVMLAADVLLVFFGGILFAVFLRGLADLLAERTGLGPKRSLAAVILTIALAIILGSVFLAAELANQFDRLEADLGEAWMQLQQRLQGEVWGRQLLMLVHQAQAAAGAEGSNVMSRAARVFSTTLGAIANLGIVIFIGIYIAANPDWYQRGLLRLVRPDARARARELLSDIGHTLRWWLFGRAVGMAVVGIVTTVGLWLLGVPLALGLGVIAAVLDFVPIVGPIVAAVPAVLVALGGGPTQITYVVALYLGIQLVEGYVLTPLIEQRSVKLPPALTIGGQVLLGVLTGALGVVLASPLVATLVVVVKRLYVEDKLEAKPS